MPSRPVFVDPFPRREGGGDNMLKYVEFNGKDPNKCEYRKVGTCLFVEYLKQQEPRPVKPVLDKLMLLDFKKSSDDDIREVLQRGIYCNAQYNFLGYSNEQLLERCCLMIMYEPHKQICNELSTFADFHRVHPIDKRAEQIGLLFSCFTDAFKLKKGEFMVMDDNQKDPEQPNALPFSADCGVMSAKLSEEIQTLCHIKAYAPSVVHVRYQGYQGLLLRKPHIEEHKVKFRKSMEMFKVPPSSVACLPDTLGIMGYSEPYSMGYLDTLSIMLLVNRGVKPEYMDELQETYYKHLIIENSNMAQWFLSQIGMSNHYAGLQDPAKASQLKKELMEQVQLKEIRKIKQEGKYIGSDGEQRQKVRVLVFQSREVFGFRNTKLKPGQCFFKPTLPIDEQQPFESAKQLLIMRRPCYNPGHVHVLELVHNEAEIPADYQGIQDCLVLGDPSDCGECGGGKLDSDSAKYFVSWDESLIPRKLSRQSSLMAACLKPALGNWLGGVLTWLFSRTAPDPVEKENLLIELRDFFVRFKNHLPPAEELFMRYACSEGLSSEKCRRLGDALCGKMDIQTQRRELCDATVEEMQPTNNNIQGLEEEEDEDGQEEADRLLDKNVEEQGRDSSCLTEQLFCMGRGRQVKSSSEEEEMRVNLQVLCAIERRALQFLQEVG